MSTDETVVLRPGERPKRRMPAEQAHLVGLLLARYTLDVVNEQLVTLGETQSATVYKGSLKDGDLNIPVAVKVLKPHRQMKAAYEKEVAAAMKLMAIAPESRRGLVEYLDWGVLDPGGPAIPYITTRFVHGKPLEQLIHDLSLLQIDRIAWRLCSAVRTLLRNGILHRDIKINNVVLDESGDPVLIDLGIAELIEGFGGRGQFFGTPAIMAPEQGLALPRALLDNPDDVVIVSDNGQTAVTPLTPLQAETGPSARILEGPHTDIFQLGRLLLTLYLRRNPFLNIPLAAIFRSWAAGPSTFDRSWREELKVADKEHRSRRLRNVTPPASVEQGLIHLLERMLLWSSEVHARPSIEWLETYFRYQYLAGRQQR